MKKILLYGLCSLSLALGLSTVDAKTYTSYNAGDKITVNVNDIEQLDFYVIEDSSNSVTAIYESVLGDYFYFAPTTDSIEGSVAEVKLNEYTSDWETPNEVRLINSSEIIQDIDLTENVSEEFSTPSYYHIGDSYWTQDVISGVNGSYFPVLVTTWWNFSSIHSTTDTAPASSGAIRPVITVDKEYVVGGVTETVDNSNNTVQNPETGLFSGICVVGTVGLLSLGVYLILKSKNVFPKA